MLSIFRSGKKKKPKKGAAFFTRENLLPTVGELKKIIDKIDYPDSFSTEVPIEFHNNKLSLITPKIMHSDFGEESFLLDSDTVVENSEIYFYRVYSEHLKFLIQVHFKDEEFYFASTKVYGDALLSDTDKKKVINRIVKKYLPNSKDTKFEFTIRDQEGNMLFTKDDVFFYINYLANNNITRGLINKHSSYMPPKPGNDLKDTLDDLI